MSESIRQLEALVDKLLLNQATEPVDTQDFPDELKALGEKLNRLSGNVDEIQTFIRSLSGGELHPEPPPRGNYLASPIKELHSQLSSLEWSMQELVRGRMVSKLYYPGDLYESYNRLVEKVSASFSQVGESGGPDWEGPVNSWRYHQILSALNHLHIMIIEVDITGRIVFANPPMREELHGLERIPYGESEQQRTALIRYLCMFGGKEGEPEGGALSQERYPIFHELHYNNGTWYKITSDRIRLTDGSYGFLHMIDDISEWKRNEQRLTVSATIDSLTGAMNRETGMLMLEELIHQDTSGMTNCIAFLDMDNLKYINDNFGHNQGDHAIQVLVRMVIDTIRDTDNIIRYGGDEFIVIFRKCNAEAATTVMQRLCDIAEEYNKTSAQGYSISFSYGVTEFSKEIKTAMELVVRADELMYINKVKKKATLSQLG